MRKVMVASEAHPQKTIETKSKTSNRRKEKL
jgi:hypothetical protein